MWKKKNLVRVYQLSAIFYFTLQFYGPEFTGLKLEINFNLSALLFIPNPEQIIRVHNTGGVGADSGFGKKGHC